MARDARLYAHLVYVGRSCAKAIPQVRSNDQPDRLELYQETVNILQVYGFVFVIM